MIDDLPRMRRKAAYFFFRYSTRFPICGEHVVHLLNPNPRSPLQNCFYNFWNSKKRNLVFQERSDRDLVCCVQ